MTYVWDMPVVNGGFANVIAADPVLEGVFYLGSDTWGTYRTEDAADSWIPTNLGANGIGDVYSRAICPLPDSSMSAYYGIGTLKGGKTTGYFGKTHGRQIDVISRAIHFGTALGAGAAGATPRPVGQLIDLSGSTIWAATSNGIAYSSNGGSSWTTIPNTAFVWKSLVALSTTECLAAIYGQPQLYHVASGVATKLPNSVTIHELRKIGTGIWAVGPGGVYKYSGGALSRLASANFFNGTEPVSIDGNGATIVVLTGTPGQKSAAISVDGGGGWKWIGQNTRSTLWNGDPFWLGFARNQFGGAVYAGSQVAVDKVNPQNIMFAGKNGVWGSHDGGKTVHPCGPSGSSILGLKAGPGANQFGADDQDWVALNSSDSYDHQTRSSTPNTGTSSALSASVGGHDYVVHTTNPRDITKDNVSIADDFFRGACFSPNALAISSGGVIAIGLYAGGILRGTPA